MSLSFKRSFVELFQAVVKNDLEKIEKIHLEKPNLLGHDESCCSVELLLVQATYCDNEEIIKLLFKFIKSGGDNNYLKEQLATALIEGDLRLAEFLLKNGTSLDVTEEEEDDDDDDDELMKLYKIIFDNTETCLETLKLLSHYKQLNTKIKSDYNGNLLHMTAYAEKNHNDLVEIAEFLLESGIPLDEKDGDGDTPMKIAVDYNHPELVSYLIKKGADVNTMNDCGEIPLFRAVAIANENIIDMLLTNGAKVNAKDDKGNSALHIACESSSSRIINLLIREGANVCLLDHDGNTPFSCLENFNDNYDRCVAVMIKALSKRIFENLSVCEADMALIQNSPKAKKIFNDCLAELNQMVNIKFYESYTYYSVLKMWKKINKLINLTRNECFVNKFKDGLSFHYFKDDLQQILDKATQVKDSLITIEARLKSTFGNSFPDIVIRILAKNLTVDDLPLE